jgi:hypothetical protein
VPAERVVHATHGRQAVLCDLTALLGTLLRLDSAANQRRWRSLQALCEANAALSAREDLQR